MKSTWPPLAPSRRVRTAEQTPPDDSKTPPTGGGSPSNESRSAALSMLPRRRSRSPSASSEREGAPSPKRRLFQGEGFREGEPSAVVGSSSEPEQRLPDELLLQIAAHLKDERDHQTLNAMSQMNSPWHKELRDQRELMLFSKVLEVSIPEHSEIPFGDSFWYRPGVAADLDPKGGLFKPKPPQPTQNPPSNAVPVAAVDPKEAFFKRDYAIPSTVPLNVGQLPDSVKGEGLAMVTQAAMRMKAPRLASTHRPLLIKISHELDKQLDTTGSNPLLAALERTGPGRKDLREEDKQVIARYVAVDPRRQPNRDTIQGRHALDAAARFLDRFRPAGLPDSLQGFEACGPKDVERFISIYQTHTSQNGRPSEDVLRSALNKLRELKTLEDSSVFPGRNCSESTQGSITAQGLASTERWPHPFVNLTQASMEQFDRGDRFRVFAYHGEQEFIVLRSRQGGERGFLNDIRPVVRGG